jgi:hypothetical protein
MLLTADHLAELVKLGHATPATTVSCSDSSAAATTCRTLEREGLARSAHGHTYELTPAGHEARQLVVDMVAGGVLLPPELMAPDWIFLDDQVLAAGRAAVRDDNRVSLPAAPILLARGLAELRDELDELQVFVALTVYAREWLELVGHLQEQAVNAYAPDAQWDIAVGSAGTEAHPVAAPA